MSEIVPKIMENDKLDSENLLMHFKRLETKWAELNENIDRFIGISDQTLTSYDDFNTFLNIASEENDVVNNCQCLARFLTDTNNHGDSDKSSETGNNGNDKVNCDKLFVENTERSETLMGMSVRESEEPSSSMKESFSSYNPNVEDTENDYLNFHDNTDSPEQLDTNYDCSKLNEDISYVSVNLSSEHQSLEEHNHDIISNSLTVENVTEPNLDVLERDLVDNKIPHPVKAVSKSTDIFTIYQNQMPNLLSNEEKGNNFPHKTTAVEEEEINKDSISLNLLSNIEKGNNSPHKYTIVEEEEDKVDSISLDLLSNEENENNFPRKTTAVEEEESIKDSISLKIFNTEEKDNNSPHKFISVEEEVDHEDSISLKLFSNEGEENNSLHKSTSFEEDNEHCTSLNLLSNEENENTSPHKSTSIEEENDKEVSTSQNLFNNEEKENNSSYKSTYIEVEEDSEDAISLCVDSEEKFFSDMFNDVRETNNSHEEHSNYADKDGNEDCLPNSNKNKQKIFIDSNLNKYPKEKQITDPHCNSIEFMNNGCDKNVSCDEENSIETRKKQNLPDSHSSDFYKDIYTWDDERQFYIEENSGNDSEESGLLSDNIYQHNSYQKTSRIDNFTDGRKRKNMILFRNVCYFYVINKCNRPCCTFPHVIPDVSEVKLELKQFNNNLLIEEYDLIKDNKIKFDYGLCFLEECSERNLSREVVRMAIDFIKIPNSSEEKESDFHSIIVKATLQHINKANNLDECRDLLTALNYFKIRCFGDILLENISETEHFSNYKVAFVKLIDIIMPKAFSNKITKDILKQICSIANEAPLSRALLNVIRYANPKILWDPMIEQFENMIKHDNELISEFLKLKKDMLHKLQTTNGVNTINATNMFHNNAQGSTNNVSSPNINERLGNDTAILLSKAALPSNLLPATKQANSNDKYVSSSNIDLRLSINNRIIYMPKEAVPNKPLSMIRQNAISSERVLSSNIARRLSTDTRNISVPKVALLSNPLPVRRQDRSDSEHISSSNINRSLSNNTKTISVRKETLPSNALPVRGQDPSDNEHVSSSNIHRRISNDTKTISVPKEVLPSNPLPVIGQDPSDGEHVSSSNINRSLSNNTKTIAVPKEALPSNPLPGTIQYPSENEHVSSSNINQRLSHDAITISVPKEALPSNSLPVTGQDPSESEHVSSSNINRRLSHDTRAIYMPKEAIPSNPLPVTRQDPSDSEHVSSSNINRRLHSNDTRTIFIPKETLLNSPLTVNRQGSCNSAHVLSSNVSRRYSSGTNKIVKPTPPVTRQQDPNYINKHIIKRRKSSTMIHPWNTKEKSLDGTKENHTK